MKKALSKLLLLIVFVFLISMFGCSANQIRIYPEQNSEIYVQNEDNQNFLELYSDIALTDSGYYFINNNLLYFFDRQSKETLIVCNKINCAHNDENCSAYFSILSFYPVELAYYDNALYVMGWESEGANIHHNYIYQISLDSYKRKKAAFLYDSNGTDSSAFILHRGYVYFTYGSGNMKEGNAVLYRTQLGNTKRKKAETVFEYNAVGADIFGLSAYGNNIFFTSASYKDTKGNGYRTVLNCIDIHSLKAKEIISDNKYSYFADGTYVYYQRDGKTVNRINLTNAEDTFFCNTDAPCYISADNHYLYFDNQQAMMIDKNIKKRKITAVDKRTKDPLPLISPKNADDECLFGGDDFMFFKSISENGTTSYYAIDKSTLTSPNRQFTDMG